jgi:hypothetical protein
MANWLGPRHCGPHDGNLIDLDDVSEFTVEREGYLFKAKVSRVADDGCIEVITSPPIRTRVELAIWVMDTVYLDAIPNWRRR